MTLHSKAEIIGKTQKFTLPTFDNLPKSPELLTHSDLSAYVNAIIRDDVYGKLENRDTH